ncbi:hypothetical protein HOE31_01130, partial [bacterium]|nr:hypothetical protein [bacterium]
DIKIRYNEKWQIKHLNTIKQNYSKSKYFNDHIDFFEKLYSTKFELLIDFNICIIDYIRNLFDINVPIIKSSTLKADGASGELLLNICKERKATVYLSGRDGRNYLNTSIFNNESIDIVYHDFTHPSYKQFNSNEFIPYINTFDLLFNCSIEESKKLILSGGTFCEK